MCLGALRKRASFFCAHAWALRPHTKPSMTKSALERALQENAASYHDKLKSADANTAEIRWAVASAPLALEPFRMELLGMAPGKFLKSAPKNIAAGRLRCCFDAQQRIVSTTEYAELDDAGQWLVYREFYEYLGAQVLRYSYGSAVDGMPDSPTLQKVAAIECDAQGRTTVVKEIFFRRLEYTETSYTYCETGIGEINIRWPETGAVRTITVKHDHGAISLHEITPDGLEQIYPE